MHYFQSTYICSKTMKMRHQLMNKHQVFFAGRKKGTAKILVLTCSLSYVMVLVTASFYGSKYINTLLYVLDI